MSQTDLNVANASGATVRADLNAHLDALVSLSSGATEPSTKFPNQWWYDTSTSHLKKRNNANTAWLSALDGLESEGTPVTSAGTADIWVTDGNTVHITGTTTITSFGTAPRVGVWRKVIFDDVLTLTDGANLNLPNGANVTTEADDFALVYAETTTLFKVLYFPVAGTVNEVTIQVFTGDGTYTKPADLLYAIVEVVGSGAGGGGAAGAGLGAGGGGGGGYAKEVLAAASIGATETVTIGAAGTGGASGGGTGGAGNTTSFGTLLSATGGAGGQTAGGPGGAGGVGSGGDINIAGGGGGPGADTEDQGGAGGSSVLGGGALGQNDGAGLVGGNYGGGGGGSGTNSAGGAGAAGLVVVTEFKS